MHRILILTLFCFCSVSLFSQNAAHAQSPYSIKGSVADTSLNIKLENTSVSVLNSKDSTLVDFMWTRPDGSFTIGGLSAGKFILLATYLGYPDYVEHFALDSINRTHDFGQLKLILKATLLKEVLISGAAKAITIKGDTTEFNASSYTIQPNDRVEDLLKQFPGFQVDQYGKITAQGKQVRKVLVDGEEFFGDDPTLVTKNIRADMVDKVQLFEAKSDKAKFSGIDDGQRTTTLNVTLKADKKNGYFGKIDAGEATDGYYQGQAMFNAFQTKQKFSAYTTVGNTNRTGLSAQDNSKYGSTGTVYSNTEANQLESFTGRYFGEGSPTAKTGGLHYDAKWNGDKQSINMNYRIGTINVEAVKNTLSQNNLPAGTINSNSSQSSDNTYFRHKLEAIYQAKLSPTTELKITADGAMSDGQLMNGIKANSIRSNNVQINSQNRNVTNDVDQKTFNVNTFIAKKFKKERKTMSLTVNQSFDNTDSKGYLYTLNNFYNTTGALDSTRIVDQYKPTTGNSYTMSSDLEYSHPISKLFTLSIHYDFNVANSSLDNKSFNKSASGKYDMLDNVFSSNFKRELIKNEGGFTLVHITGKSKLYMEATINGFDDKLTDLNTGKLYKRNYTTFQPEITYYYNPTRDRNFFFLLYRNTKQPDFNQLQPVKVNTDPLNITLGNPALKPSYSNTFSGEYMSYKALSGSSFSFRSYIVVTDNPIINSIVTDAAGKNTFQYLNLSSKISNNYNLRASMTRKLEKSAIAISMELNASGNTSYNFINNVLNKNQSQIITAGIGASKSVANKYQFSTSFNPGYSFGTSSLQNATKNDGRTFRSNTSFSIYLPGKVVIGSSLNYQFQGKTATFDKDFNLVLLNSTLTKKFLKKDNLSLVLSGNDLLNQNTGFSRAISGSNMFTEVQYSTIRRYTMLSLVWDYSKMGPAAKK